MDDLVDQSLYALQDQQFNVLALTDDQGEIVERYEYTLYGGRTVMNDQFVVLGTSQHAMNCGFQGLYHDAESGLIYNRARMLSPKLQRFIQRDPLGYPDGMNTYAAYHVMHGGVDPMGLESSEAKKKDPCCDCISKTCHIWVYFSPKDKTRENAGDMFVYNCKGEVIYYTPVRGQGNRSKKNKPTTETRANTPTGDYEGNIEGPQGNTERDAIGKNKVIRLTGRGNYDNQPAISGDAAKAKRPGLLIHGGRVHWAKETEGTLYNVEKGEWEKGKFQKPGNTSGCLRCYPQNQKDLIGAMEGEECCENWIVHVRDQNAPKDPSKHPEWDDPRVKKK